MHLLELEMQTYLVVIDPEVCFLGPEIPLYHCAALKTDE